VREVRHDRDAFDRPNVRETELGVLEERRGRVPREPLADHMEETNLLVARESSLRGRRDDVVVVLERHVADGLDADDSVRKAFDQLDHLSVTTRPPSASPRSR
jgi:hypothetical protein